MRRIQKTPKFFRGNPSGSLKPSPLWSIVKHDDLPNTLFLQSWRHKFEGFFNKLSTCWLASWWCKSLKYLMHYGITQRTYIETAYATFLQISNKSRRWPLKLILVFFFFGTWNNRTVFIKIWSTWEMQWQGLPNTHICLQMCELVLKVY